MAHKKAGTTSALGRDSVSKRLGIKLFAGEIAQAGNILVRQRGTKYHPGTNVRKGSDDTLFAVASGAVKFSQHKVIAFDGNRKKRTFVHVLPKKDAAPKK